MFKLSCGFAEMYFANIYSAKGCNKKKELVQVQP